MKFPEKLKYTKDHEWIRLDEVGTAYVGITDYAQSQLGDIVFVDITTEGETLNAEEVFGTIEVVKTVSDLFMPISGEILEINERVENEPEIVNDSPYEDGWLIKIRPKDISQLDDLLDASTYRTLINEH
ncbi:MAG TPA: glycine cleavage system protein GcvH [Bacteroidaceae bacterium]|nr:glycine cleavage system protein GcvH [Bacteroidaceae bacterium]